MPHIIRFVFAQQRLYLSRFDPISALFCPLFRRPAVQPDNLSSFPTTVSESRHSDKAPTCSISSVRFVWWFDNPSHLRLVSQSLLAFSLAIPAALALLDHHPEITLASSGLLGSSPQPSGCISNSGGVLRSLGVSAVITAVPCPVSGASPARVRQATSSLVLQPDFPVCPRPSLPRTAARPALNSRGSPLPRLLIQIANRDGHYRCHRSSPCTSLLLPLPSRPPSLRSQAAVREPLTIPFWKRIH